MYDVIIIGAGTGGMAAGIYAATKKLKILVIAKEVSKSTQEDEAGLLKFDEIEKKFEKALHGSGEIIELKKTEVISIEKNVVSFSVEIKNGEIIYSRSIIVASGRGSEEFDEITEKDHEGRIKVDANMETSVGGVYAIGSVNNLRHHNLVIDVGEASRAVFFLKEYLNK